MTSSTSSYGVFHATSIPSAQKRENGENGNLSDMEKIIV